MDEIIKQELIKEIDLDVELSDTQKILIKEIGKEKFISLCENIGGNGFYIPTLKKLLRKPIYKKVVQEFNGKNIKALIKKYDISEGAIYKTLGESHE